MTPAPGIGPAGTSPALPAADAAIVIPLYNRAVLVRDCLQSLLPALRLGIELIVVDDGSTDGSAGAVREEFARLAAQGADPALMRLIVQKNAGPGAARNAGFAATARDWILYMDSDDLWLPWTAATILQAIGRDPGADAVFFQTQWFETGQMPARDWTAAPAEIAPFADFFAMRDGVRSGLVGSGYFAIRRAVIAGLGGFVPGLRGAEDMDLFFRLPGRVLRIHAPVMVAARKDNDDSLTRSMDSVAQGLHHMLAQDAAGRYPNPRARAAIADALQFWLRQLFNAGHGRTAYGLLLNRGGMRLLLREGRWFAVAKLLASPVLAVIRPRNYRFGWRPQGK